MLYGVIMSNNEKEVIEEKMVKAKKNKKIDAIILVIKNTFARKDIYAKLIKKFGEDLNLYILEDTESKEQNLENVNTFCKAHLGYIDAYNIIFL